MEKTLLVNGMMCVNCEAHVQKALEALPSVTKARADHTTGKVVCECDGEVSCETFKKAVLDAGYEFKGLQ